MPSLIARLTNLETSFGHPLPDIYRRYLLQGRAVCESEVVFENDASEFDIRTVFGLTSSSECDQIDATYRIVKKVLPPDSLPIACDWGDNFFLLYHGDEKIFYWDHERDLGDHHVELAHPSLAGFLKLADPEYAP
jgi:hypothetical protein